MVQRVCRVCGSVFASRSRSKTRGFYCGQECYGRSKRTQVARTCQQCEASFWKKPVDVARGSGIYCSHACYVAAKVSVPIFDRILERLDRNGPIHPEYGKCWLWTGGANSAGYGHIGHDGKTPLVHRVMWSLASGQELARTEIIGHICDTPRCVRNDEEGTYTVRGRTYRRFGHLFLGTTQANGQDSAEKGRNPRTKVTEQVAQEIITRYQSGVKQMALAREYTLGQSTISRILRDPHHRRESH